MFGAFGKAHGQQAAAQGIHQAVAGGVEGFEGGDAVIEDVVGDVLQDVVVVGADVQINVSAHR
ncbi:hypothetical protein D3C75_1283170 [compost metagenome]